MIKILDVQIRFGRFKNGEKNDYVGTNDPDVKPGWMIYIKYDTSANLTQYSLWTTSNTTDPLSGSFRYSMGIINRGEFYVKLSKDVFDTPLYVHGYDWEYPCTINEKDDHYEIVYPSGYKNTFIKYNGMIPLQMYENIKHARLTKSHTINRHISNKIVLSEFLNEDE